METTLPHRSGYVMRIRSARASLARLFFYLANVCWSAGRHCQPALKMNKKKPEKIMPGLVCIMLFASLHLAQAAPSISVVPEFTEAEAGNACETVHHLEIGKPALSQSLIIDAPPQIDCAAGAIQNIPVEYSKRIHNRQMQVDEATGRYGGLGVCSGFIRNRHRPEIVVVGQQIVSPQYHNGWGHAVVSDFNFDVARQNSPFGVLNHKASRIDQDVSAQLVPGGPLTQLQQFVGGPPQGQREASDSESPQQCKKTVMPVDQSQGTETTSINEPLPNESLAEEDADNAGLLDGTFYMFVAAVCGYLGYTLFKAACHRILHQIEKNKAEKEQENYRKSLRKNFE